MSKAEELRKRLAAKDAEHARRPDVIRFVPFKQIAVDAIAALEAAEARDRERNTRGFRRVVRADRLKKEKQP